MDDSSIRWEEYFNAYGLVIIVWIIIFMRLAIPDYSITSAFCQAILLLFWSYGGHYLAHMVSEQYPFNYINPHVSIHHKHLVEIPRRLNLTLEAVVNFMSFFILYIIQAATDVHILSTSMIIGAGFLYVAIHIFDYSIFGSKKHEIHHLKECYNYEPEFMDTLFNTRDDSTKPYTDMKNEIVHASCAFLLALALKKIYHLD